MLTDTALRNLKPKSEFYKASDRDGMYVTVSPSGTVTFRYDYRLHGRRETLTLGRYGPGGISLAMARQLLLEARKSVQVGISPALEKQREKRRVVAIKTFGAAMEAWLANARLADSTHAMRKHILDRDILPVFRNRLLTGIQTEDLRALCDKVKDALRQCADFLAKQRLAEHRGQRVVLARNLLAKLRRRNWRRPRRSCVLGDRAATYAGN
nr:integrase arm-type DNA-binding domain-containing protein [Pseudomonas typographi]